MQKIINDKRILLTRVLVAKYAQITVVESEKKSRKEIWWKQAKTVSKFYQKQKPVDPKKEDRIWLAEAFEKIKVIDENYFTIDAKEEEDELFSSYMCMVILMEYLLIELEDTVTKENIGHVSFDKSYIHMEASQRYKEVLNNHNRFINKLIIEIER